MADSKKYYWLKLNQDFFEDDTMKWLEEQENGKDYIIFYLKLCLKSLSDDGSLIRYVGETLIPYDVKALAKLTNTSADTVAIAMKTFREIGLISVLDTGEIYLKQIDELIGSETESAKRVRKHRAKQKQLESTNKEALHCNKQVTKSNTEIEIEKEIDIEKDKKAKTKEKELQNRFDILWQEYPNKKGKSKAYTAYKKAIKEKTTDSEILTGIKNYKKELAKKKTEKEYIAHGSTWFNQRRWEDDYDMNSNNSRQKTSSIESFDDIDWSEVYG